MKNNQAILNLRKKKVNFKFQDQDFEIDLTEGDLPDSWNSFTTADGIVRDVNFTQEDGDSSLSVYELKEDKHDETYSTDWDKATTIEIVETIGTEEEYFKE